MTLAVVWLFLNGDDLWCSWGKKWKFTRKVLKCLTIDWIYWTWCVFVTFQQLFFYILFGDQDQTWWSQKQHSYSKRNIICCCRPWRSLSVCRVTPVWWPLVFLYSLPVSPLGIVVHSLKFAVWESGESRGGQELSDAVEMSELRLDAICHFQSIYLSDWMQDILPAECVIYLFMAYFLG